MELLHAILFAVDMKRMTAFYRDALGPRLLEARSSPGWAEFDAGGTTLALHAIPVEQCSRSRRAAGADAAAARASRSAAAAHRPFFKNARGRPMRSGPCPEDR